MNRKKPKANSNVMSNGFLPSIGRSNNPGNNGETVQPTQTADSWLTKNPELRDKNITEAFENTQDKLDSDTKTDVMFSGTTCVFVFLSNNHLVCANAGDSRACLFSLINGKWAATPLSRDHKPDEMDEAARVRRCNGRIE